MPPSADNIATFVDVVRHRSLSQAARNLGVPKSTVSRRLMRLEAALQNKLLHRNARKITLTPVGRSFYESVVNAVDTLNAAVAELEQSSQEPRGTIRMTAPVDLGRMVLSSMQVAFLERHPDIALDVLLTNRQLDLAAEGVDLAVRAGRVVKGDLIARKLCDSALQLAAGTKHVMAVGKHDDIRSLERHAFVLHGAAGRHQTIKLERGVGKRQKSVELEVSGRTNVDDYGTLAELVALGQGIGLMPAIHVRDGVESGRLVRVFPEWSSHSAQINLVYSTRQQPERVRLLTAFLLEAFARLGSV